MGFFNNLFSKKPKTLNIDELLESDDINHSIIEFDNYIGQLCNYGFEMDKINESQKLFYINQNLEREVNNGGFYQYFYNSSGDYAHETINSLKRIGAKKTAAILQKAINIFPNGTVPKDRDERIDLLEKMGEKAEEVWDNLDQKFFAYEDNLNELNIEFIRTNKLDFQIN